MSVPRTSSDPGDLPDRRDEEADRVTGFALGGSDYVTKPFSLNELIGRIRAVLNRKKPASVTVGAGRLGGVEEDRDSGDWVSPTLAPQSLDKDSKWVGAIGFEPMTSRL
jgi:DNA-binding response OmpR family regulator